MGENILNSVHTFDSVEYWSMDESRIPQYCTSFGTNIKTHFSSTCW